MFEYAWAAAAVVVAGSLAFAWYVRRESARERNSRRLGAAFERARLSKHISYTGRPFGR